MAEEDDNLAEKPEIFVAGEESGVIAIGLNQLVKDVENQAKDEVDVDNDADDDSDSEREVAVLLENQLVEAVENQEVDVGENADDDSDSEPEVALLLENGQLKVKKTTTFKRIQKLEKNYADMKALLEKHFEDEVTDIKFIISNIETLHEKVGRLEYESRGGLLDKYLAVKHPDAVADLDADDRC